jgi:hypothetical protein
MNYTELNIQDKANAVADDRLSSIEAKLDQILEHQKSQHHWAIVRGAISFILFILLVVLPVIGMVQLYKYMEQFDYSQIFGQFQTLSEGLNQIKNVKSNSAENVQNIINKIPNLQ